jgi:hypothetical protein
VPLASVCSGVAFQPVHLDILTVASMSCAVLQKMFKVNLSLTRRRKSSQFVCLLLKLC